MGSGEAVRTGLPGTSCFDLGELLLLPCGLGVLLLGLRDAP